MINIIPWIIRTDAFHHVLCCWFNKQHLLLFVLPKIQKNMLQTTKIVLNSGRVILIILGQDKNSKFILEGKCKNKYRGVNRSSQFFIIICYLLKRTLIADIFFFRISYILLSTWTETVFDLKHQNYLIRSRKDSFWRVNLSNIVDNAQTV